MGFEVKDLNAAKLMTNAIATSEELGERINYSAWTRKDRVSPQILEELLIRVANGGSIVTEGKDLGVTVFDVMRMRLLDKGFNAAMNEALKMRLTLLEEKAWVLANDGEVEEQTQTGLGTYKRKKDSIAMVQFLLKAFNPEKYGVDRKELRAGPLDTPPDVVRSTGDREKLLAKIEERRRLRETNAEPPAEEPIDVTPVQLATLDDLLS